MNNVIALLLIAALSLVWAPTVSGSEEASRSTKRRTALEQQFLYRAVEDLNTSQGYVLATMRGLEKQVDVLDSIEPSRKDRDVRSYLEWYQAYGEWLGTTIADFEEDLSRAYSDGATASVKPERYVSLIDGYIRLGSQLDELVSHLERSNNRIQEQISGLRLALEYVSSATFLEERNRDKKQSPSGSDRRNNELYDRYKNITDAEIAMMQVELRNLGDLEKQYLVLIEMGRMELLWINRKADDYDVLSHLAASVGMGAPAPIEAGSNLVIKKYESDIAFFKRKVEDISHARARLVPSGTLRTLDRVEEMSENYEQMKSRFEHHTQWLAEQTGAYRADLVELRKDK